MSFPNNYKVYCLVEKIYIYTYVDPSLPPPTTCPNNASHAVDPNRILPVDTTQLNTQQTADPTVNDDLRFGYIPNTIWTNTVSGTNFICVDNTQGAAVWKSVDNDNIALDDLSDVTLTTPTNGDSLRYNGTNWVNSASSSGEVFEAYYDPAGALTSFTTVFTDLPLDVNRIVGTAYNHPTPAPEVRVIVSGLYKIVSRVTISSNNNSRSGALTRIVTSPNGTTFTEIPGSLGSTYERLAAVDLTTATVEIYFQLNAGDFVKVQARRYAGGATLTYLPLGCSLTMETK